MSARAGSCQRPPSAGDQRDDREDERETAEHDRDDRERRVLLPPPKEESDSTVGAGLSEVSGPFQSTTVPSEYVCRTSNVYVFDASVLALKRKTESSPVGTLPPVQVTFCTTASSPEPVACTCRFQPAGEGSNESIAKPAGTVSSIVVVVAPSFSVGTESVNCCSTFAFATGGLTIACADAPGRDDERGDRREREHRQPAGLEWVSHRSRVSFRSVSGRQSAARRTGAKETGAASAESSRRSGSGWAASGRSGRRSAVADASAAGLGR